MQSLLESEFPMAALLWPSSWLPFSEMSWMLEIQLNPSLKFSSQRLNRYCASYLTKCLLRLSSVTRCLLSLYPQRTILSDAVLLEVLFHH